VKSFFRLKTLCDLCELGVSVVNFIERTLHHRDTEYTKDAQRRQILNFPTDTQGEELSHPGNNDHE